MSSLMEDDNIIPYIAVKCKCLTSLYWYYIQFKIEKIMQYPQKKRTQKCWH